MNLPYQTRSELRVGVPPAVPGDVLSSAPGIYTCPKPATEKRVKLMIILISIFNKAFPFYTILYKPTIKFVQCIQVYIYLLQLLLSWHFLPVCTDIFTCMESNFNIYKLLWLVVFLYCYLNLGIILPVCRNISTCIYCC